MPIDDSTSAHASDVARREREWAVSGDPAALWPGVNHRALQPCADAIGAAVTAILRGDRASLGIATPVDVGALGIAALLTGTGPLLGYWIEKGALDAGDAVSALLAEHLAQGRARVARICSEIQPVLGALLEANVRPAVMKGFHTAHRYFPEPGTRPFADVDVIVAPEEVARTEATLRAAGFTPDAKRGTPYKRDWRPPGRDDIVTFDHWHARNPWSIELHDGVNFEHLSAHAARLDLRDGFESAVDIAGVPLLVPRQPLLLAILATHASNELYAARLLRLVELVLVVRQDRAAGRLDWAAFEELLDRGSASRFVYPALSLAERLAPGTIDAGVLARARRATTRGARALDGRIDPTSPILRQSLWLADRLVWEATPREVLRVLRDIVGPPRDATLGEMLRAYQARLRKLISRRAVQRSTSVPAPGRREP
jgi:hypothetical protein